MTSTTPRRWKLRAVSVLALTASGWALAAETPVSIVASACPAIPANRLVNINTAQSLIAGQSIVPRRRWSR